jgi:hypothetical protein
MMPGGARGERVNVEPVGEVDIDRAVKVVSPGGGGAVSHPPIRERRVMSDLLA